MSFGVTILGSSSALPTASKHHSAHVLNVHEQFYLADCGEGTQKQLIRSGISPLKINAVFISHLHGDHIYGIFPLISTMGMLGRRTPLKIFAPRPFDEILANHLRYFDSELPYEVEFCEVHTREYAMIYETKVMEVYSIPLRHKVPAAGFLFKEKTPPLNVHKHQIERYGLGIAQTVAAKRGEDITLDSGETVASELLTYRPYEPRSYAYLSDTQYSAKAASLIKGVTLLYHEATFLHADRALAKQTGHSTALQAARVATLAEAEELIIGHFSPRYKNEQQLIDEAQTLFPNCKSAQELHTYQLTVPSGTRN